MSIFKDLAEKGETKQCIADTLNIDRAVVDRILKEFCITLKKTNKNQQGQKFKWSNAQINKLKTLYQSDEYSLMDIANYFGYSLSTISKKAKSLGLIKARKTTFISKKDQKIIEKLALKNKSIKDICERTGHCDEVVKKIIKSKEINYTPHTRYSNSPGSKMNKALEDKDFYNDISNPALSNAYLAKKYHHCNGTIAKWRKRIFGTFKKMTDTFLCKSSAEMDFENILISLNLSYIYEQRIGKWKVDYDLGFNFLVEIQGSYWHNKIEKTREKDIRKKDDLLSKGYFVMYIWDYELKNVDTIKNKVLFNLKKCIDKYYGSLNLMNLVEVK